MDNQPLASVDREQDIQPRRLPVNGDSRVCSTCTEHISRAKTAQCRQGNREEDTSSQKARSRLGGSDRHRWPAPAVTAGGPGWPLAIREKSLSPPRRSLTQETLRPISQSCCWSPRGQWVTRGGVWAPAEESGCNYIPGNRTENGEKGKWILRKCWETMKGH